MRYEYQLHDALQPTVVGAAAAPRHERALARSPSMITLETGIGPATLVLEVQPDTERIVLAAHHGADTPECRGVLELLCETITGLVVEEAAAHGVVRLLHRLACTLDMPVVPGVLLPSNGGSLLVEAERGLRRLRDELRSTVHRPARPEASEVEPTWIALGSAERTALVERAITTFCAENGLVAKDVRCEAIEEDVQRRPVRIVLSFPRAVASDGLPALIRNLERQLKRDLAPQIEVLASERTDRNKLRHMIVIEKGRPEP